MRRTPFAPSLPSALTLAALTLTACGWGTNIGSDLPSEPPANDSGSFGHDSGTCTREGCTGADASGASAHDAGADEGTTAPTETFELTANGSAATPLACPTSHWEFSSLPGSVKVKNTGSVPLAYIAEPGNGYIGGIEYTPGYPTSEAGEQVGVLAPGAEATFQVSSSCCGPVSDFALIGSSKPFTENSDAGFAPADEWTVPWPQGVAGSGGSATMYVAELESQPVCGPVYRPD